MKMNICLLSILCLLHPTLSQSDFNERVKITANGGYREVVIAIHPDVVEDQKLIDNLKDIWTKASKALYKSTKNIFYFEKINILVPYTWTKGTYPSSNGLFTFEEADVIVDEEHQSYGNTPYTVQFRPCGERGSHIHLTPTFITGRFPAKHKTIVREWAHLRWGVFNEDPTKDDDKFYYNRHLKSFEGTRCPSAMKGSIQHTNATSDPSYCLPSPKTGYLPEECEFFPSSEQDGVTSSIMSHHYVDEVFTFCHDDDSDPKNKHNRLAPNDQNLFCNFRSTWDVISSSEDYFSVCRNDKSSCTLPMSNKTGASTRAIRDPTLFNVAMAKQSMTVILVFDLSSSMLLQNLEDTNMIMVDVTTACEQFIELYAPTDSYVGIITRFAQDTTLIKINTEKDREILKESLLFPEDIDAYVGGSNDVYKKIDDAVETLLRHDHQMGADIVLFTDGQVEWAKHTTKNVLKHNIKFHTIYYGNNSLNWELSGLADASGGSWILARNFLGLQAQLAKISDKSSVKTPDTRIKLKSEIIFATSGSSTESSALVGPRIGKNTLFRFVYFCKNYTLNKSRKRRCGYPKITLFEPGRNGRTFCFNNNHHACDSTIKGQIYFYTISFMIPGIAKKGKWRYVFEDSGVNSSGTGAAVLVSSFSSGADVKPIIVKTATTKPLIKTRREVTNFAIYAQVTEGRTPVLETLVIATVTGPSGVKYHYRLIDKGTGADLRKNDGVYSAFFSDFYERGLYEVSIAISSKETQVIYKGPHILSRSPREIEEVGGYALDFSFGRGAVEREVTGTAFEYSGNPIVDGEYDNVPPGRITDLQVETVDDEDVREGFSLTFHSVGDDAFIGTAHHYTISYTPQGAFFELYQNFDAFPEVRVLKGDLTSPKEAKKPEQFLVTINFNKHRDDVDDEGMLRLGFAVKVFDDFYRPSLISNIATLDVYLGEKPEEDEDEEESGLGSGTIFSILGAVGFIILVMFILYKYKESRGKPADFSNFIAREMPKTKPPSADKEDVVEEDPKSEENKPKNAV